MMMNDEELNKEADSGKSESAFYILFAIQLILIAIGMFMPIQMGLTTLPLFTLLAIITLIRRPSSLPLHPAVFPSAGYPAASEYQRSGTKQMLPVHTRYDLPELPGA